MSVNEMIAWIFGGVAALVGGAILIERRLDTRRREALAQLALHIGFSFQRLTDAAADAR